MTKDKTKFEKGLTNVISSLLSGQEKERASLYEKILLEEDFHKHFKIDKDKFDPCDFHIYLQYPYEQFLECLIDNQLKISMKAKYFLLNIHFFENHITRVIERIEGSTCSVDKSRTIVSGIYSFLAYDRKIEFNYEGEYTYHLPRQILKTHDEIIKYYEALDDLYWGKEIKYLEFLLTLKISKNV